VIKKNELMDLNIGRQVKGKWDISVSDNFNKVSRKHAIINYKENKLFITDLDSSNGTYVNGKRIVHKEVFLSDAVSLGGVDVEGTYKIDLQAIKNDFDKIMETERIDFTSEFEYLKKVYIDYKHQVELLKKKQQLKKQIPKIMGTVVIGIVMLVIILLGLIPQEFQKFQYPVMLIVMSGVGLLSFKGGNQDLADLLTDLEIDFQEKYKCPKCKKKYNINATHWKKLASKGSCTNNCGAQFI